MLAAIVVVGFVFIWFLFQQMTARKNVLFGVNVQKYKLISKHIFEADKKSVDMGMKQKIDAVNTKIQEEVGEHEHISRQIHHVSPAEIERKRELNDRLDKLKDSLSALKLEKLQLQRQQDWQSVEKLLTSLVNKEVQQGWKPQGGISRSADRITQAMIK